MKNKFYCYDDEEGFQTFASLELAKSEADRLLVEYRENASDEGWNEAVTGLCYGPIGYATRECDVVTKCGELDEDNHDENSEYWGCTDGDKKCNYEFHEV